MRVLGSRHIMFRGRGMNARRTDMPGAETMSVSVSGDEKEWQMFLEFVVDYERFDPKL